MPLIMKLLVSGFFVLGLAAASCAHGRGSPSDTTTPTTAHPPTNEPAIEGITSARCNREFACNNIGSGRHFESLEACTRELDHDTRASIGADQCPAGVREGKLEDCVKAIHDERCGNPIDALERLASCRKGKLCR